ncbi:MAG: tetratricopeptide repeat protein [Desulfobacterales bacterium]
MKKSFFYNSNIMWVSILLFLACSGVSTGIAQDKKSEKLIINADQQYQFAMDYFNQSQYFKAIAEFERFLYFFPDHQKVDDAKYHIATAYFQSGRFREAVEPFLEVAEKSTDPNLINNAFFRLSETFFSLEDYQSAITVLDHLADASKNPVVTDEANYRAGWIFLELNEIQSARQRFDMISAPNRDLFRMQEMEEELSGEKLFPQKKPQLAGFLSILPGAGFAYCGRYQDALVAFLLNTGLFWAAYESFDSGNEALGGIIAFAGAGFYAGNIYGAISSAHKYNRDSHQGFLEQLKTKTQVTLSVAPEKKGIILGFRINF